MRTLLILLLALAGTGACAQNKAAADCQAQYDAINRTYDDQIAAFSNNPKVDANERDYRTLMLNFFRGSKLSAAEAACNEAASKRFRNCLSDANAINATFNRQLADARSDKHLSKQERVLKEGEINRARNAKLRELLESCKAP